MPARSCDWQGLASSRPKMMQSAFGIADWLHAGPFWERRNEPGTILF